MLDHPDRVWPRGLRIGLLQAEQMVLDHPSEMLRYFVVAFQAFIDSVDD